jgi:ribosomal protein S18 acetylase RimI-like enzyme
MEKIKITKLPTSYWAEYKKFRLLAVTDTPFAFGENIESTKKQSKKKWIEQIKNMIFAMHDDKIIGMLALVEGRSANTKHWAEIFSVFVNKDYRKKGIAKKLFIKAFDIAKKKKYIKVKIAVNTINKPAYNLYKKMGFVKVGKISKELKINEIYYDEYILEKLL